MAFGDLLKKIRRMTALSGNAGNGLKLLYLFCQRYHYPGFSILGKALRAIFRPRLMRLALRSRRPFQIILRPAETGDVASFFENFIEQDIRDIGLAAPRLAVDAGAHIGCFSLALHDLFPDARIIALEPEQSNFKLLQQNWKLNGIGGETLPVALWKETAVVQFSRNETNDGRISTGGGKDASTETVPARSLQDILGGRLGEIGLLKMDIEGAEWDLLPDLLPILPDNCRIYLELHNSESRLPEFHALLARTGRAVRKVNEYFPNSGWLIEKKTANGGQTP